MKRSKHALSNTHLTSMDMGKLIPIQLLETLPGDSFQMSSSALVRLAPMLSPPMHPVAVRLHHWFVPHRLVWDNFEDFITGGSDGMDDSAFPTIAPHTVVAGSLENYLGLPVGNIPAVSALPFRAYNLIWNEFYRDQDLQTERPITTVDGVDTITTRSLLNVSWPKDYFTSARPWEQKGPSVSLPTGGDGSVQLVNSNGTALNMKRDGSSAGSSSSVWLDSAHTTNTLISGKLTGADSGISINQLRESLAIQRFEEARAMYGSRYAEYLRALGVSSSDARLNRPEYLGGGVQTIQMSEIVQSAADGTNPVGTLRGHGITAMKSNRVRRFFEEHGYVMTLMSILPKSIYMNGIARTWNRRTKFDFWQRELEHLGQQEIQNKEIYAKAANPDGVFGYQDRYEEYRRQWSRVTGEFATTALDYWHFGRNFAAEPALNSTFVSAVPTMRPFASAITHPVYVQVYNNVKARRLVTRTATPRTF